MKTMAYPLFQVVSPGSFTTIQDKGRFGYQRFGVPINGVMDSFAAAVANLLVGGEDSAAVLECTFLGPTLIALDQASVAVTGARMAMHLNGQPVPGWTSFPVMTGDLLEMGGKPEDIADILAVMWYRAIYLEDPPLSRLRPAGRRLIGAGAKQNRGRAP